MTKIVVITGGTAGIGRATTKKFTKAGYKVAVLARDENRLKSTEEEVKKLGGEGMFVKTDVANFNEVKRAAKKVKERWKYVDIWINNAMSTIFSEFKDISSEDYKRQTEVTYLGTVWGTKVALESMWKRNIGTIVQVGSALSYRAIPLQSPYCGAKHAVRGFTDSIRTEIAHNKKNIHITMIQLPAHNTPQFTWGKTNINKQPQPVPPIYSPKVAANAIFWGATNKRREVWVGKSSAATIIGNKVAPGLVDKYLAKTGYESQWINKKVDLNRPNNLHSPVEGNFSEKGIFEEREKPKSTQFTFEKIPILHYFTNLWFALIQSLKMVIEVILK